MGWGREATGEERFRSCQVQSARCPHAICTPCHRQRGAWSPGWDVPVRSLPCAITPFSPPSASSLGGSHCALSPRKETEQCSLSMDIRYSEFFRMGNLSLLPYTFVYSALYVYLFGLTDIQFILWVIIQCYFIYSLAQIVPVLVTGSSFSRLLGPLDLLCMCFSVFFPLVLHLFLPSSFLPPPLPSSSLSPSSSFPSGSTRCPAHRAYFPPWS